jgi:predicted lipoprotein with Yx(FWY)xxD motif
LAAGLHRRRAETRGRRAASLLGTIERRDGRKQVTHAAKPLYFYAHEGPGECAATT